jgi:hypothetical protein
MGFRIANPEEPVMTKNIKGRHPGPACAEFISVFRDLLAV